MEIKKYKHIEYVEESGKLFRIIDQFRFPMTSLEDEEFKDKLAMDRIMQHGPTPYPFPRDYQTLDNWEDERDLHTGVYPPTGIIGGYEHPD